MNSIRRRPCADPVQKPVPGEWMTQKGIDSSRPVTEAWCAHIGSEHAHQYSQRRHRKHPAFPRANGFTASSALSPGTTALLTPSSARWRLANLTPASGRQNHTASPSATGKRSSHAPSRPPQGREVGRSCPIASIAGSGSTNCLAPMSAHVFVAQLSTKEPSGDEKIET